MSTGEIKNFTGEKAKRKDALRSCFEELRALIRANFEEEAENQVLLTLTYKANMQNAKQLYEDWHAFYLKLKRAYKKRGHKLEYIAVAEPQERGAWHLHVMLKSDKPTLFIDPREWSQTWRGIIRGGGNVHAERMKSDDMGTYYVSYFTDLTTEAVEAGKIKADSNARKKGGRLRFYPKGMRFFRCSRGITRPEKGTEYYGDIKKEYGEPTYAIAHDIIGTDESGADVLINSIQEETFKRPKIEDIDDVALVKAVEDNLAAHRRVIKSLEMRLASAERRKKRR